MSQGKQTKKCRQNFNVYIPPPARKAGNISQQVIKGEELKNQKVKVRSEDNDLANKNKSPSVEAKVSGSQSSNSSPLKDSGKQNEFEFVKSGSSKDLSVTLSLSKLSITCEDVQKLREKQSDDSLSNSVETPKDNDCKCTFSSVLSTSEMTNDICLNEGTLKDDLHKCSCSIRQKTDRKTSSPNKKSGTSLNPEEENRIFKTLWVKLCDQENLESKTIKSHNMHKGNEVYGSTEINENCILEIYDFPAEFKTSNLREIFSSYITRGMKIRWVDDTHALGIYPSEIIAYEVLNTDLPNLKTRNLNEGIQQSKDKAKLLLPPPPPPRPKTCSASARRMVSGALGIKAVFTPAEIEEERQLLQVAREQRLLAKQRGLKGS